MSEKIREIVADLDEREDVAEKIARFIELLKGVDGDKTTFSNVRTEIKWGSYVCAVPDRKLIPFLETVYESDMRDINRLKKKLDNAEKHLGD